MRFSIRDDDVNYHFPQQFLADSLYGVSEICPITLAVVPWFQGNWRKNLELLESMNSTKVTDKAIQAIKENSDIYRIDDNLPLMQYLAQEVKAGRVSIAQHGIHHQNKDESVPIFVKNYGIGAEFYTSRDLSNELSLSNQYLNDVFDCEVGFFTPPQNLLSEKGLDALMSNGLNVCGYLPSAKNYSLYKKYFSAIDFFKVFKHRLFNRKTKRPYPYAIKFGDGYFIEHVSLQPATRIDDIIDAIDFVAKKRGDFVLSTHTYAFNYKMVNSDKTIKEALIYILDYVQTNHDVQFVTMNEILR